MKNNPTSLDIVWSEDGTGACIIMNGAVGALHLWMTPIEVEAMILNLCQSPWRVLDKAPETATLH